MKNMQSVSVRKYEGDGIMRLNVNGRIILKRILKKEVHLVQDETPVGNTSEHGNKTPDSTTVGNMLTSSTTISFSRKTLLCHASQSLRLCRPTQ